MTTYNAYGLAVTIEQRVNEAQQIIDRMGEFAKRLMNPRDEWAHDHAEEQLGDMAERLSALSRNTDYLATQYSRTGIARKQSRREWGA